MASQTDESLALAPFLFSRRLQRRGVWRARHNMFESLRAEGLELWHFVRVEQDEGGKRFHSPPHRKAHTMSKTKKAKQSPAPPPAALLVSTTKAKEGDAAKLVAARRVARDLERQQQRITEHKQDVKAAAWRAKKK